MRWGRSVAVMTAVLISLAPVVALAQPRPCDRERAAPVVHVHEMDMRVTYDNTKSTAGILAAAAGDVSASPGESIVVRGLTAARFVWRADISFIRYPATGGGGYCAYAAEMDLTIGYPDPATVYVERDYQVGTCQHTAVLEHEENHVRIHRESFADHLPLIVQAAETAMADPSLPLQAPDEDTAIAMVQDRLEAALAAEVSALATDRDARHAYLDRPESIAMTQASCATW